MSTRKSELTRQAARLFAEKGYHGTSIGDLAEALGLQKGSLYAHIESKADLLWEVAREGAEAFHAALDGIPEEGPVLDRIEAALRAHLRVVAEQLDIATVFVREWRFLEGERRERFVAERRRYEERIRALFREGRGPQRGGRSGHARHLRRLLRSERNVRREHLPCRRRHGNDRRRRQRNAADERHRDRAARPKRQVGRNLGCRNEPRGDPLRL